MPLSTGSSPRVPSQQGKQDKGQMAAFVFIAFHATFGICPLPTPSLLPSSPPSHFGCLTQLPTGQSISGKSGLKKEPLLCLDQALQRQKGMKATMRSTIEPSTTPTIKYGKSLERATIAPVPRPLCPPLSGGRCRGGTVEGGRRPGRPRDFRAAKGMEREH